MEEGWQMNGRWKEGGLIIELFKTTRASMKFDRMIPSGSSWLMGVKVQRVVCWKTPVLSFPGLLLSGDPQRFLIILVSCPKDCLFTCIFHSL